MGSVNKGLRPFLTSKSFTLLHSLTPVVVVDPNVVSNHYHPLNRRVLERIRAEETNEPRLIITALAPKKNVSKNAVVRNKAVRRVREAVMLRTAGNDCQKVKSKSTLRPRFGLERGPDPGRRWPELSGEQVRSGSNHGKSLGDKDERGTRVAHQHRQGPYIAGGNRARRPVNVLTSGQGLQQKAGSEINSQDFRMEIGVELGDQQGRGRENRRIRFKKGFDEGSEFT
ncbi:uncharacterized protein H6S33_001199 [Morchella sextelata]|uniref:uncharacterized protein n=1 Tax=Morchella sextelata TaxID=1174677 RepID=UPI001D03F63D|nr:uncharacterized protein H6S33_001199 [Morchella sextelata]KAH0608971.1 hypothetical protein H6S33_001199 [Morchella sextelata]